MQKHWKSPDPKGELPGRLHWTILLAVATCFQFLFFNFSGLLRTKRSTGILTQQWFWGMWRTWTGWKYQCGYHTGWTTKTWERDGIEESWWSKPWLRYSESLTSSTECCHSMSTSGTCHPCHLLASLQLGLVKLP